MTNRAFKEKQLKQKDEELRQGREDLARKEKERKTDKSYKVSKTHESYAKAAQSAAQGVGAIIGALNDPSWYKAFPELVKVVSQLPVALTPGYTVEDGLVGHTQGFGYSAFPTVIRFDLMYAIGPQPRGISAKNYPVNAAGEYLMSQMRAFNSRSGTEYDPGDLLQVIISLGSIAADLEKCKQAIACLYLGSPVNPRFAESMYTGYGFQSYSTDKQNRANLLDELNEAIIKFNYLPLPDAFTFIDRWRWLSKTAVQDRNSLHSQIYTFNFGGHYRYDMTNELDSFHVTGGLLDLGASIRQIVLSLEAFENNNDITVMFSDIRAAFTKFVTIDLLDFKPTISLVCADEVLDQIMNITLPPCPTNATIMVNSRDIHLDTDGYLYQGMNATDPGIVFDCNIGADNCIFMPAIKVYDINGNGAKYIPTTLNLYKDDVSPDDILVASRLTTVWEEWDSTGSYQMRPAICGSEIVEGMVLVSPNPSGVTYSGVKGCVTPGYSYPTFSKLTACDWLPKIYVTGIPYTGQNWYTFYTPNQASNSYGVMHEWNTVIKVSDDNLKNLHKAAIYSEFSAKAGSLKTKV